MEGEFDRVSPASFAEKIGIPDGWVVISHRWVPTMPERRRTTGNWFKIESDNGTVFRVVRFSPNLQGSPATGRGQLVIDWSAWLRLSGFAEDTSTPLKLKFTRSRWWNFWAWMITHPEPTVALSGLISLISLGLGIVSLVLAIAVLK